MSEKTCEMCGEAVLEIDDKAVERVCGECREAWDRFAAAAVVGDMTNVAVLKADQFMRERRKRFWKP